MGSELRASGRNLDVPGAKIALCHNPDTADWPVWGTPLPPPILPVENKRYTSGVIAVDATRTLYINRGIGYLIRVRFNARPELTLFRLRGALAVA